MCKICKIGLFKINLLKIRELKNIDSELIRVKFGNFRSWLSLRWPSVWNCVRIKSCNDERWLFRHEFAFIIVGLCANEINACHEMSLYYTLFDYQQGALTSHQAQLNNGFEPFIDFDWPEHETILSKRLFPGTPGKENFTLINSCIPIRIVAKTPGFTRI